MNGIRMTERMNAPGEGTASKDTGQVWNLDSIIMLLRIIAL